MPKENLLKKEIKHRQFFFSFFILRRHKIECRWKWREGNKLGCLQSYKTSITDVGSWRAEFHVESVKGEYPQANTEITVCLAGVRNIVTEDDFV